MSKSLVEKQLEFVNYRFGMFIHFNSATFQFAKGDICDWEYGVENGGEPERFPFDEKKWNPTDLDCTQWAKAGKSAGVEFAALTTKHHEGFDLWPSQYTEHCVKNGSVTRDVVREYLDAFRAEGIRAGLYFSMLDIHNKIGRYHCSPEGKQLIKNQLTELMTNYGEIPFIIFDGWQAHWGGPSYENVPFEEICDLIHSYQPDCLIMNISCESNLDHTDMVFYENAAGQEVEDDFQGPGVSCNLLSPNWFWREADPARELKPASWAIEMIQKFNDHNVTFILNASPNQKGLLDDNMVQRYAEIGKLYQKAPDLKELPEKWLYRKEK